MKIIDSQQKDIATELKRIVNRGESATEEVAAAVVSSTPWAQGSDRDYRVRGRHSRRFFQFADELLRSEGIADADGEVWLQTYPRVLGYVFKPVSFWYCERADGTLAAIVVEVNNTFGERHAYLLDAPAWGATLSASKVFHVSPFCEVEGGYRFRFFVERKCPVVRIDYDDAEGELLLTSVSGRSTAWSTRALLGALLRMPLLTAGIVFRIHWQALRLWIKGVPFVGARSSHQQQPLQESAK